MSLGQGLLLLDSKELLFAFTNALPNDLAIACIVKRGVGVAIPKRSTLSFAYVLAK
jgi:hypothetical protein